MGILWKYGTCNGLPARKNRLTGRVYFVLWKAGQHGHKKDYWINFDSYWRSDFKPLNTKKMNNDQFKTDFNNTKQLAEDCWLFLTDDPEKDKATITKEAFLHEVVTILEIVKQNSSIQK